LTSLQLTTRFTGVAARLNLALVALGGTLFVLYRYSLHSLQADSQGLDYIVWFIKLALIQLGVYLAAAWVVWRVCSSRSTLLIVVIFAALFRLSMVFRAAASFR